MAIVAPLQGHFDGGELSPRLYGRVDAERYKGALALCKNWIATLQGDLPRRPGTYYLGQPKSSVNKSYLIPFQFSTTQSYMLEFGDQYIRFWANYGQVTLLGSPYEISAPYLVQDVPNVRFVQSADVLYLVHPSYAPMKLQRYGATNWQIVPVTFLDGPYESIGASNILLSASATSGVVTLTATNANSGAISGCTNDGTGRIQVSVTNHGLMSGQNVSISGVVGTTEANALWSSGISVVDTNTFILNGSAFVNAYVSGGAVTPAPFVPADSSKLLRLEYSTTWYQLKLISINANGLAATAQVLGAALPGTTAAAAWRKGLWGPGFGTPNYPATISFHEDRLCFSGTPSNPQRIDMSVTADYENFAPSALTGTVNPNSACNFSLNSNDVNASRWLTSDEKGLLFGGLSAEWLMRPSVNSEAITPTNVNAKRSVKWGSANIQALLVGRSTLHIQRGGRKLRELLYSFYIDGYQSTDLTELAEHITTTGVIQMTYASVPFPIVWLLRNDGVLLGATYDRDIQQVKIGWHWHVLGGQSDSAGTAPVIESIAVIPSPDGTKDDLWMVVKRWINGSTVRTVEYLSKIFEDIDLKQNAFFLDCGLTLDSPVTVSAVTKANPAVVTATAHGFSTGYTVRFDSVVGMTQLNGNSYVITVINANSFSLNGVNSTAFGTFISGQVRRVVSTVSGLSAFNGETFAVYADGVVQNSKVVSGGAITLDTPAAVVSVGYAYNSDGQQLRLEAGSRNGTSLGKTRRTHRVATMVHRAQGLQMGPSFSQMDTIPFNQVGDSNTLFTGIESHTFGSDYDFDNPVCFRVSTPQPCTMLAIMPMMEEQDRA